MGRSLTMELKSSSAHALKFLLILLVCVSSRFASGDGDDSYELCKRVTNTWLEYIDETGLSDDKLALKDLLFFLHVPRTGGRTYFHCFLRKLYKSADECPRSYDRLRFNPSKPNCKLVVSHDDYSLITKLPRGSTSVVTILRNPIDRIFSTYEFSVEVAARFLVHPNLTSATTMSKSIKPKGRAVSTLDVWPWKYLVPWMREDLFHRRDARKLGKLLHDENADPYSMEDMVMPIHKFINHPIAHDIVHNGATFQVTGLTNNSHYGNSHEIRQCVRDHPSIGQLVLDVAKRRLDRMLYVGLTEDHEESARLFANMVGAQVLSQSGIVNSEIESLTPNVSDSHSALVDSDDELSHLQNSTYNQQNPKVPLESEVDQQGGNRTVTKLMETYESCIGTLRKSQSSRRTASLKRIAPANFSKEARLLIPEAYLEQIRALNSLDMELYEHAKKLFLQQQGLMRQVQDFNAHYENKKAWPKTWSNGSSLLRTIIQVIIAGIFLVCIVVLCSVHARKGKSKVKV